MGNCVRAQLCSTLCDPMYCVACQAPLSMRFLRQEYWSGLPLLPPGDLPDPGMEPMSLVSPAMAGRFFTTEPPEKPSISPKGNSTSILHTFKNKWLQVVKFFSFYQYLVSLPQCSFPSINSPHCFSAKLFYTFTFNYLFVYN